MVTYQLLLVRIDLSVRQEYSNINYIANDSPVTTRNLVGRQTETDRETTLPGTGTPHM